MKKVLCIGNITTDVLLWPVEALPKPGTLVLIDSIRTFVGGCAANAAIDLARLGVPAGLCCKAGDDAYGRSVLAEARAVGLDVRGMVLDPDGATAISVVTVSASGERSTFHSPGSTLTYGPEDIPLSLVDQYDIVFLAPALILPRLDGAPTARLFKYAQERGKFTAMDTAWDADGVWMPKIEVALPYLDLFMPSIDEAEKLADTSDIDAMADAFFAKGTKNVVIKMGSRGAYVCEASGERYISPAFLCDHPVDTNGAGDSFCAGFLCALARGQDFRSSARFANAVGRHSIMAVGTSGGVPHMGVVDAFLRVSEAENEESR